MAIKILGNKIIRDSRVSIFNIKNRVFKIPLSVAAIREIAMEKEKISEAKNDPHFSPFLPDYKYFLFIQNIPYYSTVENCSNFDKKIRNYFGLAFSEKQSWPLQKLEKLIDSRYFLKFISDNFPEKINIWEGFLKKIRLPESSCHGDFYPDNILIDKDRLFFIDWTRYSLNSSRYFDLIDYDIFSRKDGSRKWSEFWLEQYQLKSNSTQGVEITSEYLLAYAIWKIAEEIKTLNLRNKFSMQKAKKYQYLINFLSNEINK